MTSIETEWERVSLVPRRRLGALLSSARVAGGITLEEVAERADGHFTIAALASIERGTRDCTDTELRRLSEMYGLEATSLVPARSRLIIDVDEGVMAVDEHRTTLGRSIADRQDVLSRYLAMVYSMRQVEPGARVPLRIEDLEVLGRALHIGSPIVECDLRALMANPRDLVGWRSRVLRRRILIPAAGVLVAVCGVGTLVLVADDSPATTPGAGASARTITRAVAGAVADVQVGSAAVQQRAADGSAGPVETRAAAEPTVTTSTIAPSVGLIDPLVQERESN